jgi:hypothetical protein
MFNVVLRIAVITFSLYPYIGQAKLSRKIESGPFKGSLKS